MYPAAASCPMGRVAGSPEPALNTFSKVYRQESKLWVLACCIQSREPVFPRFEIITAFTADLPCMV